MSELLHWLSQILSSWKFWVVVEPWDIGVRVRLGQKAMPLAPGPHWRIPFLDAVTMVNTRLRISSTPPVTIAAGEKARVVSANVGFSVTDPLLAMLRFTDPNSAVLSIAQSEVAGGKSPIECETRLRARFDGTGIEIEFLRFVEDVEIPALRLLQNSYGVADGFGAGPPGMSGERRY